MVCQGLSRIIKQLSNGYQELSWAIMNYQGCYHGLSSGYQGLSRVIKWLSGFIKGYQRFSNSYQGLSKVIKGLSFIKGY